MKAWKAGLLFLTGTAVVSILYMGYFCYDAPCALIKGGVTPSYPTEVDAYLARLENSHSFKHEVVDSRVGLNFEEDVLVFLHMQKTGGSSFGRHLVENLVVDPPCNCYKRRKFHCDCLTRKRKIWLFSRFSTGWPCGVHADWTELKSCVNDQMDHKEKIKRKRRYHYVTILRDPIRRFLSEWKHVQRGATWKTAHLNCNGREASLEEVPFCYDTVDWKNVSLDEFINCPSNLAINRQSRMLANLSLVNCYDTTGMLKKTRDKKILASAKENLLKFAFFGLVEYQNYTQYLFEHTFGMTFQDDFVQFNSSHGLQAVTSKEQLDKITELNSVDMELYKFAKELFFKRVQMVQKKSHIAFLTVKHMGGPDNFDTDEHLKDEKKEESDFEFDSPVVKPPKKTKKYLFKN